MRKSPVTGGTQPHDLLAKSSLVTQLKPPAHGRLTFVPTSLPQVSLVQSGSFCGWAPSFSPQRLPTIGSLVPACGLGMRLDDRPLLTALSSREPSGWELPWDFPIICSLRNTCLRCYQIYHVRKVGWSFKVAVSPMDRHELEPEGGSSSTKRAKLDSTTSETADKPGGFS